MTGIAAYGGYIPRLRLVRKAAVAANAWREAGLKGSAKGERAMRNWDEDSLTMAVEAGRDCLTGIDRAGVNAVVFASTTMPFADRQNSGVIANALNLSNRVRTLDVAASQKAGTSGLAAAFDQAAAGRSVLFLAADARETKSGTVQELKYGDGAAGLLLGEDDGIARLIGQGSVSYDFVDHFREARERFDYGWEERWVRDEGYMKIVPEAVEDALAEAGIAGKDIDHFIMPTIFPAAIKGLAKKFDIRDEAVCDTLGENCGETGTAHSIVMLVHALESAKPGEKVLVIGFGQGADALVFEVTKAIEKLEPRRGIAGSLADRKPEENYNKYLTFRKLITQEYGMRAERDQKTALTTLWRQHDTVTGLVGGKCTKCGTLQFPKSRVCVNPNCGETDSQENHPFADMEGKVMSYTADNLTFSLDPPHLYGMVTFEEGGRFMAEFTDHDEGEVDVGLPMRMMFRIHHFDERRGFRSYFWKAAPDRSRMPAQAAQAAE